MTRDTDATPFTVILEGLIDGVSGAYAAALVDPEGETVDYTGPGDPFDVRIAAAELQLILQHARRKGGGGEDDENDREPPLGELRWLVLRGPRKSAAVSSLPDGYALALLLRPRFAFTISMRALRACTRALAAEAGWAAAAGSQPAWFPVAVEPDRRGRPVRVRGRQGEVTVEVLGALMGLSVRERGFRVRTADGRELTLVCEPRRRWYADEDV